MGGPIPARSVEPFVRIAPSRGFEISFEDAGAGPALVLVNGLGGTAAEWRELGYVERLAAGRRVLSVDPLGHGRSSKPHDGEAYRSPAVAADLVAALDAAGVGRAALWGYSNGARLACTAAIEFPDRVSALILGGQGFTDPPSSDVPAWAEALAEGDWDAFWAELPFEVSDYDRQQMASNDPRAVAAAVMGARRSGYVFDLRRVGAPTLLYAGGGDDPEDLRPTGDALGVDVRVVGERDHLGTFTDVDGILPIALAHLDAAGA